MLQGKILFVVFGEIQRLFLHGDPLGGIVLEFPALVTGILHALLGAEDQILFQLGAELAVAAGRLDFFCETA